MKQKSCFKITFSKVSYLILLSAFFSLSCGRSITQKQAKFSLSEKSDADCIACERIALFKESKELVSNKIWEGLDDKQFVRPLLYFSDSSTYVAFSNAQLFRDYKFEKIDCENSISLLKLPRLDARPFIMENRMNFTDTASLYYFSPMMLCSDVETMHKFVPDFTKTEDWLQLVIHEYFHSFQFSHRPTIDYLAEKIRASSDTLNQIYIHNNSFRQELAKENEALLRAISSKTKDSLNFYVREFLRVRENRRQNYKKLTGLDIITIENFWETIEGTARYAEYYMAGNFNQINPEKTFRCDTLFKKFEDYAGLGNFEDKAEFRQRTKIMPAYYYVTGFNMCRVLDKMDINYKQDLFSHPEKGLYEILVRNTNH